MFDWSKSFSAINVKIDRFILEQNSSFEIPGMNFSSKLDRDIISIAITAPKKIRALIRPMKFLSPEVAHYLYKSSIQPCIEYCMEY